MVSRAISRLSLPYCMFEGGTKICSGAPAVAAAAGATLVERATLARHAGWAVVSRGSAQKYAAISHTKRTCGLMLDGLWSVRLPEWRRQQRVHLLDSRHLG